MCGIFGIISSQNVNHSQLNHLALCSRRRGRDSSGLIFHGMSGYIVKRADYDVKQLLDKLGRVDSDVVMGHSRLITNGMKDNQPVVRDDIGVLHNGIIVNDEAIWKSLNCKPRLQIDTEVIAGIAQHHLELGDSVDSLPERVLSACTGTVACALVLPRLGKVWLFSNNGSLYVGSNRTATCFASERYSLETLHCTNICQVRNTGTLLDIPTANRIDVSDDRQRTVNFIPAFKTLTGEEALLEYPSPEFRRCTRCILPETMPFISFNSEGVCNYCVNYETRNSPKPKERLIELVDRYRRDPGPNCIVPFSGGRDSCYALHLIVRELKMDPIAYTYDWGMITDLGRRNISRMCSALGVENIIIADDIAKKRRNIARNLRAWLKSPHLGMISILTAGDKHFFRHIETVKKRTGINLNLWGINPLEVTHFKAGFLGVKPDFEEKRVYAHGMSKQLKYQMLRLKAMLKSPGYFNSSLWDTLSGEFYRSFTRKRDYYHIFDYWRWDEDLINRTLATYDWEWAPDTNTSWRIGDGTAAFYNYIYYSVAGFTEHDTFRSNQIREGQLSREEALTLVQDENRPRYQNIRWYLDTLGMDFSSTIRRINEIPRLYPSPGVKTGLLPRAA